MNIHELGTWEQLQKKLTWEQLGGFSGKRILEFGCGNGVMGAHYAKDNTVIAIEPNAQVLTENPYEDVEQICGDFKLLSRYEDESFDVIFCHNVLEYAAERAEILKEFQRLLKKDGLLSVLKHNRPGRVMQMTVLLNNFEHANELLDGACGVSPQFGEIHYYEDEDLIKWAPKLRIEKILGMRTFWDLQQNQDIQKEEEWQQKMMRLEQRVSGMEEYRNIAFFHHVFLRKGNCSESASSKL
ncbi:MAG: methyltransferase domain-containing protein [Lachnospiraceae bacterium]|nr:methyltransferase domain-containing protein [Lachnospiraceae bacterium]